MASRYVCVECEDQIEGAPSGSCATCLKTAAHDTDGSLCPGCFAQHVKGKGRWRGHDLSKDSRTGAAEAVLARADLVACPTQCTEHGKTVDIACSTCREPALCAICLSKHHGHSLVVLVKAAPIARSLLRAAAGGSTASSVEAARASAQRIARERDELPDRIASAAERIDALRDSLLAAVVARHAALRAALAATDAAVGAALAAELAVSDGLQQQASDAASDLAAAAEGLVDADAVAHADALIDRSSRVRAAIASLPPRPATASLVALEIDAGAEAALLQGIAGLGRVVARGEGEERAPSDDVLASETDLAKDRIIIPHFHSRACNHARAPAGEVLRAAKAGDVSALRATIAAGGSTEEADKGSCTASYLAAREGHLEALRTLLAAGANPAAASIVRRAQ